MCFFIMFYTQPLSALGALAAAGLLYKYIETQPGASTHTAQGESELPIFEREYGRDSTKVADVLNSLGCVYSDLGDQAKQRDMLERALAIKERAYGPDHIEIAPALFNLGRLHEDLGEKAKAREFIARALAIAERTYGSDHPRTDMCREYLADLSS